VTALDASTLRRQPATTRLASTAVRDILTGKNISVALQATDDSLQLSVTGSPKDLETGLQLVHALLTDGVIEESALRVWKEEQIKRNTEAQTVPMIKAYEALAEAAYSADPRLQVLIPNDRIEAMELAAGQAWFDRLRKSAPIETAVVGEIDAKATVELVGRYLGSLPKRESGAAALDKLRTLKPYEGPWERHVNVATMTPLAGAIAGFMGCEGRDVHDSRALEVASNVLTSRLIERVREELGLVYSLRAINRPSPAYRDGGIFVTMAPCDPAKAGDVVDETHKIFAAFAETGPTEEELVNAKKQIENNLDESLREPRYWIAVLQDLNYHGRRLEDQKNVRQAFQAFTGEQVKDVFKKYYQPKRQFSVTAVPTAVKSESEPASKEESKDASKKSPEKTPEKAAAGAPRS
jgi:zinc protease